jgi:hypothetical protein
MEFRTTEKTFIPCPKCKRLYKKTDGEICLTCKAEQQEK